MNDVKYVVDGETLKQVVKVPDHKFTAKEVIDMLQQLDGQIGQIEAQKHKAKQTLEMLEANMKNVEAQKKLLLPHKADMEKFQLEKLKMLISGIKTECKKEAEDEAKKIIDKDPEAYTEEQKLKQKYVIYQQKLARNEKVANKIAASIITKYMFDEPIFDNPFK